MKHGKLGIALGLVVILTAAGVAPTAAYAGDDANDWVHDLIPVGYNGSGGAYDMAMKPGTDIVGVASSFIWDGSWCVGYWECQEGVAPEACGVFVRPTPPVVGFGATVSIAYTSEGLAAIAWAETDFTPFYPYETAKVWYVRQILVGGVPTWMTPECLITHSLWGIAENCTHGETAMMRIANYGLRALDLAFDKRDGFEDEGHIVYAGCLDTITPQMCASNDHDPLKYSFLGALHALLPGGPWTASIVDDVQTTPSPRLSLATGENGPPQLVFEDLDGTVANPLDYAVFSDVWTVIDTDFAEGTNPSLVLDPYSGEPRVAYGWGAETRFIEMVSGVWLPSVAVHGTHAAGNASQSLSIGLDSSGGIDMKLIASSDFGMPVVAYDFAGGVWTAMSPHGQVSYSREGGVGCILVNPDSLTDPWVLTRFSDGLGLAKYGEIIEGCGAQPIGRNGSVMPSSAKALWPLLAAVTLLGGWFALRARRRSRGGRVGE